MKHLGYHVCMKTPYQKHWLRLRNMRSGNERMCLSRAGIKVFMSAHTWDSPNGFGAACFRVTIHYDSVDVPLVTCDELMELFRENLCMDSLYPVLTITQHVE